MEATAMENQLVSSQSLNFTMKNTHQETNNTSAPTSSRNWFWIIVAAINLFILADMFLNSGKISIDLLFLLTGGYRDY